MAHQHHTEIHGEGSLKRPFIVTCDCGYVSREYDRISDARDDESDHIRMSD